MKLFEHLLLCIFFSSSFQVTAQITIKGNLNLSDSTQTHIVTTQNGDQYTGRILKYDSVALHFLHLENNLIFPTDEIELVSVNSLNDDFSVKNIPTPVSVFDSTSHGPNHNIPPFKYKIISPKGRELVGKITGIDKKSVHLTGLKNRVILYKLVDKIVHLGSLITNATQPSNELHQLKTKRGNTFMGQLIAFDGEDYVFLMENGSALRYRKKDIKSISLEPRNPATTKSKRIRPVKNFYQQQRLFLSPTALVMEENLSEFHSYIIQNSVDHGLTNNITVGAGTVTLLLLNGLTGQIKIGASPLDYLHLAAGAKGYALMDIFFEDVQTLGLFYGSVAIGSTDQFINLSAGVGKTNEGDDPVLGYSLGGSFRTDNHWRIFFEYLFFKPREYNIFEDVDNTTMGTLGLSWFNQRHQIDFGLHANSAFDSGLTAVPVIGYSLRF